MIIDFNVVFITYSFTPLVFTVNYTISRDWQSMRFGMYLHIGIYFVVMNCKNNKKIIIKIGFWH